jgi:hypothetical protein
MPAEKKAGCKDTTGFNSFNFRKIFICALLHY